MSPNPGKVKEVKEWSTVRNETELESFLSLIFLYGTFGSVCRYRCLSI